MGPILPTMTKKLANTEKEKKKQQQQKLSVKITNPSHDKIIQGKQLDMLHITLTTISMFMQQHQVQFSSNTL